MLNRIFPRRVDDSDGGHPLALLVVLIVGLALSLRRGADSPSPQ